MDIIVKENINYYPEFISKDNRIKIFDLIHDQIKSVLIQHTIQVWGKEVQEPRFGAFFSIGGIDGYTYSKRKRPTSDITKFPALYVLMKDVSKKLKVEFNSCLVNWYRDGEDYIGEHSDDEKDLKSCHIASISLGSERDFVIRSKKDRTNRIVLSLLSGSLLHMYGGCQKNYTHGVPKRKKVKSPRMNITFRVV